MTRSLLTKTSTRKQFLATLALLATGLATPAFAQGDYPNKPVKLVVPFSPGGNTDLIARMLAQGLGEQLGQPVIVENLAGANGSIGASRVAGAPNDGYTLLFGTAGTQAINQSLYRNLGEKNLSDYAYVALVLSLIHI